MGIDDLSREEIQQHAFLDSLAASQDQWGDYRCYIRTDFKRVGEGKQMAALSDWCRARDTSLNPQERLLASLYCGSGDGRKGFSYYFDHGVSASIAPDQRQGWAELNKGIMGGNEVVSFSYETCFGNARDALKVIADYRVRGIKLFLLDLGEVTNAQVYEKLYSTLRPAASGPKTRKPRFKRATGEPVDEATAAQVINLIHSLKGRMTAEGAAAEVLKHHDVKVTRQAVHQRWSAISDESQKPIIETPWSKPIDPDSPEDIARRIRERDQAEDQRIAAIRRKNRADTVAFRNIPFIRMINQSMRELRIEMADLRKRFPDD